MADFVDGKRRAPVRFDSNFTIALRARRRAAFNGGDGDSFSDYGKQIARFSGQYIFLSGQTRPRTRGAFFCKSPGVRRETLQTNSPGAAPRGAFFADVLVAEVNQGGDMVRSVLSAIDRALPLRAVRATRGKRLRAEPVAMLYAQGRVKHAGPPLAALEDAMADFGLDGLSSGA